MGNDPQQNDPQQPVNDLRLFHTGEHPCGYWPERTARDLVLDPRDPRLPSFYPTALRWGFRRSGDLVYRPHCAGCRACVAVRIPVMEFQPDRSQRRCALRNLDVEARVVPAERTEEHLSLYRRYLAARHRDGGMDEHGAVEFEQFLVGSWSQGRFLELRQQGQLLAVAVTDITPDAFSAVYTFFDRRMKSAAWGRSPSSGNWTGPGANRAAISTWVTGFRAIARWTTSAVSTPWSPSMDATGTAPNWREAVHAGWGLPPSSRRTAPRPRWSSVIAAARARVRLRACADC